MKMKFKSYIHSLLITVILLVIASCVGLFFQYLDWSEITIVLIYIISLQHLIIHYYFMIPDIL